MIKLADYSTTPPSGLNRKKIEKETKDLVDRLADLQEMLYAQKKHSVLVVVQGMDAAGKDGAVQKTFEECHPVGVKVVSFRKPTEEEFAHDFLWRIHQHAPAKGMIQVFIRSHYEDVLIQRVHKWIDKPRVDLRIQAINAFEELLAFDNNTLVIKFYLHISKDQQEKELQERLDEPDKHWKHNANDWKEREQWDEYMRCYQDVINRSSIPWHIVPVDERWYRDYVIAKTMVEELEKLDLAYPPLKE